MGGGGGAITNDDDDDDDDELYMQNCFKIVVKLVKLKYFVFRGFEKNKQKIRLL